MWRAAALIVRRTGVAAEAFDEILLGSLAPAIVSAIGDDRRLRRFVANLRPADLDPEIAKVFPPLFDGFLEFWFDNSEDAVSVMSALSRSAPVRAAAAALIEPGKGVGWLAEEFPKKPESGKTGVKFLVAGDPAEGWSVEAAQKYWNDVHPVVAQSAPEAWTLLSRYVQFHGRDGAGLDLDWLARVRLVPLCADIGFARQPDLFAFYTNEQYLKVIRPDEEKFSRPGEMLAFVSGEERTLLSSPARQSRAGVGGPL